MFTYLIMNLLFMLVLILFLPKKLSKPGRAFWITLIVLLVLTSIFFAPVAALAQPVDVPLTPKKIKILSWNIYMLPGFLGTGSGGLLRELWRQGALTRGYRPSARLMPPSGRTPFATYPEH